MKTAERENPNRRPQCVANRADGAASQYRSCSIMWAAKQENFQPAEKCFFLTSPFIELTGHVGTKTSRAVVLGSLRQGRYFTANSFSNSSFENLAPSSVSVTDLALVAGFEM